MAVEWTVENGSRVAVERSNIENCSVRPADCYGRVHSRMAILEPALSPGSAACSTLLSIVAKVQ